ncbi:MAG: EscU/YscU/HrcU family type III secretion system export apparatus switch protein [Vulcanimicrobiota bacterium]
MDYELMRKKAVALGYDENDPAPRLLATGKGFIAQEIIDRANELNIPIVQDKALVTVLEKLDAGDYIPRDLYMAVAEILVFAMELDQKEQERRTANPLKKSR